MYCLEIYIYFPLVYKVYTASLPLSLLDRFPVIVLYSLPDSLPVFLSSAADGLLYPFPDPGSRSPFLIFRPPLVSAAALPDHCDLIPDPVAGYLLIFADS